MDPSRQQPTSLKYLVNKAGLNLKLLTLCCVKVVIRISLPKSCVKVSN